MNCTQVGVFKKANKVCLCSLLEGEDSRALETEVTLEVLGDLTNEALEWKLPDEEISGLLVTTDLAKGNGAWAVTVGLFNTSCSRGGFTRCLRS